ncbi:MAG: insulinase family protein [Rhodospirillales bacterium]|nr:MAG: insulinase family protein [Rhodospirillales bacterium]
MIRVLALLAALILALPAHAVTVERVVSPGGIEAWLVEDHANPIIALELSFRGGAASEPATKAGLATLMASLLDEGAGPYQSQDFQARLEDQAIHLSFTAGKDSLRGHVKTLSSRKDEAFRLLGLALTQPRFDAEPLARMRNQLLANLARELQSPEAVAGREWFQRAFAGHPYALPANGTPETLKAITRADIKDFAARAIARDTLVVGVVGDITPDELARQLDAVFGPLPAQARLAAVPETTPLADGATIVIPRDLPQSVAVFGGAGIKRGDPDWYAGYVLNYILGGGGFSARLTEEVREKRGLAYSVYSYLGPMDRAAVISGGVATKAERMAESLAIIRAEWRRLRDEGATGEELADAKTYLTGSFALQLSSTEAIASTLVAMQEHRLGIDYLEKRNALIEAVTMADLARVARRLLDPDHLTAVVVGRPLP